MFLLVDGCPLQTPARDRGIGRYTCGLLSGLATVRPDWRIEIVEHAGLPAIPSDMTAGLAVRSFDSPFPYDPSQPATMIASDHLYADWLLAQAPDHVLFASVYEKLGVVPTFVAERVPMSAVVYDVIPLVFPEHYGVDDPAGSWYVRRTQDIAGMDLLFAISEATARDVRRVLGLRGPEVRNVQGAVAPGFAPFDEAELAEVRVGVHDRLGIREPFILYVGGEDYRKNLDGAVRAFAALPEGEREHLQLVIACHLQPAHMETLRRLALSLGVGHRVVVTGFISDSDLTVLYQSCRLFFFPSRYEGLGLPVLEALHCGAPVVCSNTSSLPEYSGGCSWRFDPEDADDACRALLSCLSEPRDARRHERVEFARSFNWTRVAEAVAAGIESASSRVSRIRAAGVGHLPEWDAGCGWDLVTTDATTLLADPVGRQLTFEWEGSTPTTDGGGFSLVLLVVDEHPVCRDVLAVARQYPTVVIVSGQPRARDARRLAKQLLGSAEGIVALNRSSAVWARSLVGAHLVDDTAVDADETMQGAIVAAAASRVLNSLHRSDRLWRGRVARVLHAADVADDDLLRRWATLRVDLSRGT